MQRGPGRPPRYPAIVEDIKKRIAQGNIKVFPTHRETTSYYNASNRTIAKVWEALKADGIIEAEPGQRTILKKRSN